MYTGMPTPLVIVAPPKRKFQFLPPTRSAANPSPRRQPVTPCWYPVRAVSRASRPMNCRSLVFAFFLSALAVTAQEWTRFRGPNGSGISTETGFPTEFNKSKNLVWRTPVRPGKSSPVLTRRHVFLTALEKGKLFTQCFDRETGKLLWERSVDRGRVEPAHPLNHPAAITPVTDGDRVYVFFPEYGLLAY